VFFFSEIATTPACAQWLRNTNVSADDTNCEAELYTGDNDNMALTAVGLHSTGIEIKWETSVTLR
jgi:hypothetical protein